MAFLPLREGLPLCLSHVSADLQSAFGAALTSYSDHIRRFANPSSAPKIINDPVWHTVRVEPWEVVVLDCPIVQRLRGVHQLGLAGLVYPGAGYSRFEHSIGVLNQTQRFIEAINRNARAKKASQGTLPLDPIQLNEQHLLRLSGMLHDIGHGFLSHVSERAMAHLPDLPGNHSVASFLKEAKVYFKCRKPPAFDEILAALIVMLPEFVELLHLSQVPGWDDTQQLSYSIASLIVGGVVNSRRPFLNEMISGALDADKLDYMSRDCYMAGLPMPVDVERLLEKVNVVRIDAVEIPEYKEAYDLPDGSLIDVLAVEPSGGRTVEEMVITRVLLYEKLYHHQKVRAMEGLIENALEILVKTEPAFRKPSTYLSLSDDEFLRGHWPQKPDATAELEEARQLVLKVLDRKAFARAFAFGPAMMLHPSPESDDDEQQRNAREAWEKLKPFVSRERSVQTASFRSAIVKRAKDYLEKDGQPGLAESLTDHLVIIDLPDPQGIAEKTRFYIGNESAGLQFYADVFHVGRWAEAYENQKTIGYVFCPPVYAIAIHLATRSVVSELTGITFTEDSLQLTKLNVVEVNKVVSSLAAKGIHLQQIELPATLKADSSTTTAQHILSAHGDTLQVLAQRFHTFQSPASTLIDVNYIVQWLQQFPSEEIPLAIKLISSIKYWNRYALDGALHEGVRCFGLDNKPSQFVALGGPTTSGHHLAYLMQDVKSQGKYQSLTILSDIEHIMPNTPLVFYDDYISSGGQSITVFQQWFNVEKALWKVQENHVSPLKQETIEKIQTCPIKFVFVSGQRTGLDSLIAAVRLFLPENTIAGHIVVPEDIGCLHPASGIFSSEEALRARSMLEAAGRRALTQKSLTWGSEKTDTRILGYGNFGGLTAFYYNVPTATVSALWSTSLTASPPWVALFQRRERK